MTARGLNSASVSPPYRSLIGKVVASHSEHQIDDTRIYTYEIRLALGKPSIPFRMEHVSATGRSVNCNGIF